MKRKSILGIIAIVAVMALVLVGCTGKKETSVSSSSGMTTSGRNSTPGDNLFDIPKDEVSGDEAAIAEIPNEMFKGVGKLSYCMVMTSGTLEGYKYTLSINLTTGDNKAEAALEKLIDYYKSIGATVVKANEALTDYNVTFDYAQSVSVSATSSGIQLQFSVVRK